MPFKVLLTLIQSCSAFLCQAIRVVEDKLSGFECSPVLPGSWHKNSLLGFFSHITLSLQLISKHYVKSNQVNHYFRIAPIGNRKASRLVQKHAPPRPVIDACNEIFMALQHTKLICAETKKKHMEIFSKSTVVGICQPIWKWWSEDKNKHASPSHRLGM